MKKITVISIILLSILVPVNAQAAQTTFNGGPLTNLGSSASIHIALSNFPATGGLYILECAKGDMGMRPTLCVGAANQLWISTSPGASFKPTDDIVFKPVSTFTSGATTVDCTVLQCGIFLRFDHTLPTDTSEDQFIALTFSGSAPVTALPVDEITATINGQELSSMTPLKIAYRQLAVLSATSKSGAALTFASLAPACALAGMKITALKGSGYCDIAITSLGTATASSVTAHFPLELTPGVQTIPAIKITKNKKTTLAAKTNFGESVTYLGTGSCTISKNILTAKKGTCTVVAGARGQNNLYSPLNKRVIIKVK
jgi:hypothetical protein